MGLTFSEILAGSIGLVAGAAAGWVVVAPLAGRFVGIAGGGSGSVGDERDGALGLGTVGADAGSGAGVAPLGVFARLVIAAVVAVAWMLVLASRVETLSLAPALLGFSAVGTALAVVDFRLKRLPISLTAILAGVVAAGLVIAWVFRWLSPVPVLGGASGAAVLGVAFLVVSLLPGRVLGMGDVWLAIPVGFLLGWLGIGQFLAGLVAAAVFGGIGALVAIGRGARLGDQIPFGPALLAGAFFATLIR